MFTLNRDKCLILLLVTVSLSTTANTVPAPTKLPPVYFCPDPSTITCTGDGSSLTCMAPGGWISTIVVSKPLASTSVFNGATYHSMLPLPNDIICSYGPSSEGIKMANQNMYLYKPASSSNWQNEACNSNNIHDCPLMK